MEDVTVRFSEQSDKKHLIEWLSEPGVLRWFPMCNHLEVEDAAKLWMSFTKYHAVLTAVKDGIPCGIANLYLNVYKNLSHHALMAIIVDPHKRNQGIGTVLIKELFHLGKERHKLEIMHLEVYEENPAINLYRRLGFEEYGFQKHFLKEEGRYRGKHLMQRML